MNGFFIVIPAEAQRSAGIYMFIPTSRENQKKGNFFKGVFWIHPKTSLNLAGFLDQHNLELPFEHLNFLSFSF
jgi:hypothetical protein